MQNNQAFKCLLPKKCMAETTKEGQTMENILEVGEYQINGPDNGEIKFDKMTLAATSGAKRVWKVKSMTNKEIILEIVKFG
jgi:hypothetical protein